MAPVFTDLICKWKESLSEVLSNYLNYKTPQNSRLIHLFLTHPQIICEHEGKYGNTLIIIAARYWSADVTWYCKAKVLGVTKNYMQLQGRDTDDATSGWHATAQGWKGFSKVFRISPP